MIKLFIDRLLGAHPNRFLKVLNQIKTVILTWRCLQIVYNSLTLSNSSHPMPAPRNQPQFWKTTGSDDNPLRLQKTKKRKKSDKSVINQPVKISCSLQLSFLFYVSSFLLLRIWVFLLALTKYSFSEMNFSLRLTFESQWFTLTFY